MTRSVLNSRKFQPAPYRGVDFRIPVYQMPPEYSPDMRNFMTFDSVVRKRYGHEVKFQDTTANIGVPLVIPFWNGTTLQIVAIGNGKSYNGTTSAVVDSGITKHSDYCFFQNTLCVVAGTGTVFTINASTLNDTAGPSFTAVNSATTRKPICSYRERLYVLDGTTLYYGGVGSVAAVAMTGFSLVNLVNGNGGAAMATISMSGGINTDQYLVIVSQIGEVLIYSGSYPGGTDWQLVNKFVVEIPPSDSEYSVECIEIPNDVIISSVSGFNMYSVRDLMTNGRGASQSSYMETLRPKFERAVPTAGGSYAARVARKSCCYWANKNALAVLIEWSNQTYTNTEIAVIDISSGVTTLHSFAGRNAGSPQTAAPNQIRCSANRIVTHSTVSSTVNVLQLFDHTVGHYYDYNYGVISFQATAYLPPFTFGGVNKSLKNWVLYSTINSNHDRLKVSGYKDFDLTDLESSSITYGTALTSTAMKLSVVPAYGNGGSAAGFFITDASAVDLELGGVEPIFESGGEY